MSNVEVDVELIFPSGMKHSDSGAPDLPIDFIGFTEVISASDDPRAINEAAMQDFVEEMQSRGQHFANVVEVCITKLVNGSYLRLYRMGFHSSDIGSYVYMSPQITYSES